MSDKASQGVLKVFVLKILIAMRPRRDRPKLSDAAPLAGSAPVLWDWKNLGKVRRQLQQRLRTNKGRNVSHKTCEGQRKGHGESRVVGALVFMSLSSELVATGDGGQTWPNFSSARYEEDCD